MLKYLLLQLSLVWFAISVDWAEVEKVLQSGVKEGYFSGGVLAVANQNSTLYKKAIGTLGPKRGLYSSPMTADLHFDLGFLTAPIALNMAFMELYNEDRIALDGRVSTRVREFDNNNKRFITVKHVLEHSSGLPATLSGALPTTAAGVLKAVNQIKPQNTTEQKFQFSELGLIAFGEYLENTYNSSIPQGISSILIHAGMRDTGFLPKLEQYKLVPSGYTDKVSQGTPYNRLAHLLGNVAGNGGLFSTSNDVVNYMQILLNKGRLPRFGQKVFSEEAVNLTLTVNKYSRYKNTRALGWETVPEKNCPCGTKFSPSPDSFGASDPSASYIWADRNKNVTIVFLANGAFPGGRAPEASGWQGRLSDAIMVALGY